MSDPAKPDTVTTERLTLRPFTLDDLPAYVRIRDEASVRGWLRSPDEPAAVIAERSLRHFMDEWDQRGYGPWAVIDRRTGDLLGHHGLRRLPEFDGETEILYTLTERVRRQGIGVEAGRAALAYGFETLGLDRVMAITLHDNLASRGVMERLGLTYRRDTVFKGHDVVYYALDREDWLAAKAA
ncbi:ribosomal-protein-alanine N-acetyltransferase [Stella humosa]|uniref:Ribosomal-protein-alanine N-acetyltransferase n=1 Tax=Stella humosa TaxID=94 RepID=A0A3N1KRS2_9PROT|nr:GNAT family protein [Stella humosa]ROP81038.1 ribosomal-protein-alanine N-acetyltransferase [Stella humosa]BBK29728.1 N-acetyltransferase [Stella humosa]